MQMIRNNFTSCVDDNRGFSRILAVRAAVTTSQVCTNMQLTTEKALQIYEFKLSCRLHPLSDSRIQSLRGQSGPVAKLFGVTSRTIRDIWNRQSWSFATRPLWNREPDFIATMAGRRAGITTMEVWHFLELFHSWPRLDHYIQQDVRDKQLKAGRTKVSRGNSQRIRRLKTLRAAAAGPQCDYSEESSSAVPELEGIGNEMTSVERPLLQGLNTFQKKLNA